MRALATPFLCIYMLLRMSIPVYSGVYIQSREYIYSGGTNSKNFWREERKKKKEMRMTKKLWLQNLHSAFFSISASPSIYLHPPNLIQAHIQIPFYSTYTHHHRQNPPTFLTRRRVAALLYYDRVFYCTIFYNVYINIYICIPYFFPFLSPSFNSNHGDSLASTQ